MTRKLIAAPVEIGTRSGRLVVVARQPRIPNRHACLLCCCDCGNIKEIRESYIRHNCVVSCGCARVEHMRRLNRNGRNAKHGGLAQQHRKEHVSWYNMLTRCTRPSDKSWADYGGRGITVCDRWLDSFTAFFEDMGPKPSPAHQLERVDNDKGYSPENCVWATREEQARNKRNSVKLEYEGKTWICADLARHLGISGPVLRGRVNRGWQPCDWGLPVGMKPSQSVA